MKRQLKVCVLFGGQNSEHEVSCMSASYIIDVCRSLPEYEVICLGISKQGRFSYYAGTTDAIRDGSWLEHDSIRDVTWQFDPQSAAGFTIKQADGSETFCPVDVFVPILHGKKGEDGTIQGFFDLLGVPYVGCGVLASATGMDKVCSRMLFDHAKIPQAEWTWLRDRRYRENPAAALEEVLTGRQFPLFVKPANAGSSVGVSKVHTKEELIEALELAFAHDQKAVIEAAVDAREIEVSVLELADQTRRLKVSVAGEIIPDREFYDYDAKYRSPDSKLCIPAEITEAQYTLIEQYARRAFRMIDGNGLCRADFFIEKTSGRVLLNEVNTLPGFTSISMYPKLMLESGYPAQELIRALIDAAIEP